MMPNIRIITSNCGPRGSLVLDAREDIPPDILLWAKTKILDSYEFTPLTDSALVEINSYLVQLLNQAVNAGYIINNGLVWEIA